MVVEEKRKEREEEHHYYSYNSRGSVSFFRFEREEMREFFEFLIQFHPQANKSFLCTKSFSIMNSPFYFLSFFYFFWAVMVHLWFTLLLGIVINIFLSPSQQHWFVLVFVYHIKWVICLSTSLNWKEYTSKPYTHWIYLCSYI